MSVTVIVGGQFGSEGKGKTTAHLCRNRGYDIAIRCGGPNSGHTVTVDGEQYVLQQIPAGIVDSDTDVFLSSGCLINIDILFEEIDFFDISDDSLLIDRNAVIIRDEYIEREKDGNLRERISSTCSGTGEAVSQRALRADDVQLAQDVPELEKYVGDVAKATQEAHQQEKKIAVEGTQGFGLSVYHSPHYPYATSRDTTAAGFISEVGISPLDVSEIIMVLRTFPIRVPGNSGPLPKEIEWATIQKESGYPHEIAERTSVTNRVRRVARFDMDIVERAAKANAPTEIALMGADFLDYDNHHATEYTELTDGAKRLIERIERVTDSSINLIGTGPLDDEMFER